ncbi:phosphate-starvation-inducible PsiE family protein [Zooshikella sp. RANM57]|uniref:phosphate-starvation-inducible PsiE family protein n=1 Tax=Zooshikella sp. RANM57 TaxID=3425863 RepID=UPI003D6F71B2
MKIDMQDKLIYHLQKSIHFAVRVLAILRVFVIIMGVIGVGWALYQRLISPSFLILTRTDMLATFGAFLAVLIAIEIFINITVCLRDDVIHVKIVMATALMAIARKVIIMDHEASDPFYIFAIGVVVLSMSVGYWLIHRLPRKNHLEEV